MPTDATGTVTGALLELRPSDVDRELCELGARPPTPSVTPLASDRACTLPSTNAFTLVCPSSPSCGTTPDARPLPLRSTLCSALHAGAVNFWYAGHPPLPHLHRRRMTATRTASSSGTRALSTAPSSAAVLAPGLAHRGQGFAMQLPGVTSATNSTCTSPATSQPTHRTAASTVRNRIRDHPRTQPRFRCEARSASRPRRWGSAFVGRLNRRVFACDFGQVITG